jgi:hypothetical protein
MKIFQDAFLYAMPSCLLECESVLQIPCAHFVGCVEHSSFVCFADGAEPR